MLSLCLKRINKVKNKIKNERKLFSFKSIVIKITKVDIIAEREEYLKNKKIINHTNKNKTPYSMDIENKIPIKTATPLPPLNFNHTGNK